MAVIVEIERAGRDHAMLHREDVAMSALAGIEELPDTPFPRSAAVESAALHGELVGVQNVVIGDHHDFVGVGEARNAERVELALGRRYHAVVYHDEIGHRVDDFAWLDGGNAARAREYFFNRGHSHCVLRICHLLTLEYHERGVSMSRCVAGGARGNAIFAPA